MLGVVDAVPEELFMVINATHIDTESTCLLLTPIASHDVGELTTIVLDNARYQKGDLVLHQAAKLGIELLFLPSYSPI